MLDTNDEALIRRYIDAAEHYFAVIEGPDAQFDKPFVPRADAAFTLARLSGLIHHLRLGPNLVVLDFGAGMCWLSGVLARMGCRPIALDVSPSALRIGERALRGLETVPTAQRVRFEVFDGFTFPVADGSVDRVVCFDALHHVPNKTRVLSEMFRVLRPGGLACFAEPGPGHSEVDESLREAERFGVLEDEVAPRELCRVAQALGFSDSYLVPVGEPGGVTWSSEGEELISEDLDDLSAPTREVLIVLRKGREDPDSRSPSRLAAAVKVLEPVAPVEPGEEFRVRVCVTNTGDTKWLAFAEALPPAPLDYRAAFLDKRIVAHEVVSTSGVEQYRRYIEDHQLQGTVAVGAQLLALNGTLIDRDYGRGFLGSDLSAGETAEVEIRLVAPRTPGMYALVFDLVDEYVAWFADAGSAVARDYLHVRGSTVALDSRRPGVLQARIELAGPMERLRLPVRLTNTGDTVWLAGPLAVPGDVHVGLQSFDADGALVNRNWRRLMLPRCVAPGESIGLVVDLRQERHAKIPRVRLDLVAEGLVWFEEAGGSSPLIIDVPRR
jgi:SAM-dependent methyltransferase